MPAITPDDRVILDVGCGMGQTLIGAALDPGVEAFGVDVDAEAVEAGRLLCSGNIHLSVGAAEDLPFEGDKFDLVICRVVLPYTYIGDALAEMNRVLKPGGRLWLVLHPFSMYKARLAASLGKGRYQDAAYCLFICVNGVLFNTFGVQMNLKNRHETFQSEKGIRRALAKGGFANVTVTRGVSLVAECTKTSLQ